MTFHTFNCIWHNKLCCFFKKNALRYILYQIKLSNVKIRYKCQKLNSVMLKYELFESFVLNICIIFKSIIKLQKWNSIMFKCKLFEKSLVITELNFWHFIPLIAIRLNKLCCFFKKNALRLKTFWQFLKLIIIEHYYAQCLSAWKTLPYILYQNCCIILYMTNSNARIVF